MPIVSCRDWTGTGIIKTTHTCNAFLVFEIGKNFWQLCLTAVFFTPELNPLQFEESLKDVYAVEEFSIIDKPEFFTIIKSLQLCTADMYVTGICSILISFSFYQMQMTYRVVLYYCMTAGCPRDQRSSWEILKSGTGLRRNAIHSVLVNHDRFHSGCLDSLYCNGISYLSLLTLR
jgi:hypothetical protein